MRHAIFKSILLVDELSAILDAYALVRLVNLLTSEVVNRSVYICLLSSYALDSICSEVECDVLETSSLFLSNTVDKDTESNLIYI